MQKKNKRRIFFDMDGTLCEWSTTASIEEVAAKGYFRNRPKVESMCLLLETLKADDRYEVYILSSVFMDNHSVLDKMEWNKRHTQVPVEHQIYVPYGTPKQDALEYIGGLREDDVLIDDNSNVLKSWEGVAIKVYNGINGTKGSWKLQNGLSIHAENQKDTLYDELMVCLE